MSESLLPKRFLFRFAAPCRYKSPLSDEGRRRPRTAAPPRRTSASWKGKAARSKSAAAWSEAGLAVACRVEGKRQPVWCRDSAPGGQRRPAPLDRHARRTQRPSAGGFAAASSSSRAAAGRGTIARWRNGCRFTAPGKCPRRSPRSNCPSAAKSAKTATSWRRSCRRRPWPASIRKSTRAGVQLCGARPGIGSADVRRRRRWRTRRTRASGRRWS